MKKLDTWLKREEISSVELARYLGLTRYTISKWRERKTLPIRLVPILEELILSDRRTLQRHLARQAPELF